MIPKVNLSDPEHEFTLFSDLLLTLRNAKPDDRSELARHYQILITDLEKLAAYHHFFVCLPLVKHEHEQSINQGTTGTGA